MGNPFSGFESMVNNSKRQTPFGGVMDAFKNQADRKGKLQDAMTLEKYKNTLTSPKEESEIKKNDAMAGAYKDGRNVFTMNPATGELEQTGNIGRFDRVLKKDSPSGTEASQLSGIDTMLGNIGAIREYIKNDPQLPAKSNIPFVGQDYKAHFNSLMRNIALETGGKNLTVNELNIVKKNLPNFEDTFTPSAMETKLSLIEQTLNGVKSRMSGGSFGQQRADDAPDASTTSNNNVNIDQEKQIMAQKIASGKYDIQKLKNIFKQRTGQDYV